MYIIHIQYICIYTNTYIQNTMMNNAEFKMVRTEAPAHRSSSKIINTKRTHCHCESLTMPRHGDAALPGIDLKAEVKSIRKSMLKLVDTCQGGHGAGILCHVPIAGWLWEIQTRMDGLGVVLILGNLSLCMYVYTHTHTQYIYIYIYIHCIYIYIWIFHGMWDNVLADPVSRSSIGIR